VNAKFITTAELARRAECSVAKVINHIAEGMIVPAGRAGAAQNAAFIFDERDIPSLLKTLSGNCPHPAGRSRQSRDTETIKAKAQALLRASEEVHP
jgi:hypothetical protein